MRHRGRLIVAALALLAAQTPAPGAPVPPKDQQDFCAMVERARAGAAVADAAARQTAVLAARAEVEAFMAQHTGIDWFGPVGRIIFSEKGKAGGEIEACPSSWVGGLSPDGGLDSDTWAEPETRLYNRLRAVKQGQPVEIRAALLGIYDMRPDFPAKIWLRARIVDISPVP